VTLNQLLQQPTKAGEACLGGLLDTDERSLSAAGAAIARLKCQGILDRNSAVFRVTHTDVSLYQIELALLTSSGCRSISVIERISTEQISNK
jgi:hypothetical protein